MSWTDCRADIGTKPRVWEIAVRIPRYTPLRAGPRRDAVFVWCTKCTRVSRNRMQLHACWRRAGAAPMGRTLRFPSMHAHPATGTCTVPGRRGRYLHQYAWSDNWTRACRGSEWPSTGGAPAPKLGSLWWACWRVTRRRWRHEAKLLRVVHTVAIVRRAARRLKCFERHPVGEPPF